jgi:hypothetical protein
MGRLQKIVSFDFDNTLCMDDGTPNYPMLDIVRQHAEEDYKCYIVTARNRDHESKKWIAENDPNRVRIKDFIKKHELPIKQCHFTDQQLKGRVLWTIGACRHYDDRFDQRHSASLFGIEALEPIYAKGK